MLLLMSNVVSSRCLFSNELITLWAIKKYWFLSHAIQNRDFCYSSFPFILEEEKIFHCTVHSEFNKFYWDDVNANFQTELIKVR